MIFKSLTFWSLVAGLLVFLAKFLNPNFPLTNDQVLALIVSLLGLVNVVPQVRSILPVTFTGFILNLIKSKPFWVLVSGLVAFIVRYYIPTFPLDNVAILALLIFVLGLFNVQPELRARNLLSSVQAKAQPNKVKGPQPK